MSAETLISRLDRIKRTGAGTWIACCPAHQDKRPSLSISEKEDGRVLVHCFAGCSIQEVLGAVGLNFDALYPDRPIREDFKPRERRPFPAIDVLRCLGTELLVTCISALDVAHGKRLSNTDQERLMLAADRLQAAVWGIDHV